MSTRQEPLGAGFAGGFPSRFEAAISDARGALAGFVHAATERDLIDAATLARLHENFRLRVELEMEVASIMWQTAEIVCALSDACDVLRGPRAEFTADEPWLAGAGREVVTERRARTAIADDRARNRWRRPDWESPAEPESSFGSGSGQPHHWLGGLGGRSRGRRDAA